MNRIRLRGLRAGNLRDVSLELPHGRWTAFYGPSGSGKTALLFGVLEPVSRRRFRLLADPHALPGGREAWLQRLADEVEGLQPVLGAAGEIPRGRAQVQVGSALDLWPLLAEAWRREGARRCTACGTEWRAAGLDPLLESAEAWPEGAAVLVFSEVGGGSSSELLRAGWTRVRLGAGLARLEEAPETLPGGAWLLLDRFRWAAERRERLAEALREALRKARPLLLLAGEEETVVAPPEVCPSCGKRAPRREAAELTGLADAPELVIAGRSWNEWREAGLSNWLELPFGPQHASRRRLQFLHRTGLGHLAPARTLGTLSLGEARRLELVGLLSQVRRDQLVLFDEPGMGLHGSERREVAALLSELVLQGNTVLTADPAREFLQAAEEWVQLGPGGGPEGGRVVARGKRKDLPPAEVAEPLAEAPPVGSELQFAKLRTRFLDVTRLSMPLERLVAVAGVSGSGKSTLFEEELVPRLRAGKGFKGPLPDGGVSVLLERALGHAAISTLATLSGAWTEIRRAFADGEEARIRGLAPGDFTALPRKGACHECGGHGADRDGVLCPACDGLGLREDLLEVRLRGRPLREWLVTPLEKLERRLPTGGRLRTLVRHLIRLGLGGRTFGERGRRLSLGERSRIALARALAGTRRDRPKLFLLDEPCLGLPFREARRVVALLRELTAEGHSFWVVEHHEVLLRGADWLVELGPGAGPDGGRLLYAGPPAGVLDAQTPTGAWLREGAQPARAARKAARRTRLRSEALPDDHTRAGRAALEADLLRELATRSPLVANLLRAQGEPERALPPTAWPAEAPKDATLLDVLGLAGPLEEHVLRDGRPACAYCGGAGPWPDLVAAAAEHWPRAGTERVFTTPLALPEKARGQEGALLQAAGFRKLVRGGAEVRVGSGFEAEPGDEVWLDRLGPAGREAVGRLRDVEHHARLLGGGAVHVRPALEDGGGAWDYRQGACRDCGRGTPDEPAPRVPALGGLSLDELADLPLQETAAHLRRCGGEPGVFARAEELLAGSSLLARAGSARRAALSFFEARLARLAGWLLFPLPGVVLLHDQPLSGLPAGLARRLAETLLNPAAGAHRFTDPEGYARSGQRTQAKGSRTAEAGPTVEPFPLEMDLDEWGLPPPADREERLRESLGLTGLLREHYLRTEEARVRGWKRGDLVRGPGGRVCPECRGRGGERPHPEIEVPCRGCGGSGWARETAALEDRGLRWTDLGGAQLGALREHFSESPSLSAVLVAAEALGLGGVALDTRLSRLPLGARVIAPLAAWLAEGKPSIDLRLAAPAAGLSTLEARRFASRMNGYLQSSDGLEWRDHHPALHPRTR